MKEIELALAQVPLFALLPQSELEQLASVLRQVEVAPGTILFSEGEYGEHFYVILAGQLEVVKAMGTPDEKLAAVRGPGDFIGEMSLLNQDGLRTASVRAASQARLFGMTRADFDALLHRQPQLAYEMVQVLSARLKTSQDNTIRDLHEKNRQLRQAYEELKAAQAQIIEKEKMERELQVAHNIQMSLLPRKLPIMPRFDFGARIVPMTSVGGDMYDFIPLGDDLLGIAIGDVSGHGVPAALFMALTIALLRAEACRGSSPSQVLRGVNRQLINLNGEGMFVTMLYGVLNRSTGDFCYVRAGHDQPILYTADGTLIEPDLKGGLLLGLFYDPMVYEQTVTLSPGSTLLLYTDGVTEAADTQADMFGEERLKEAVRLHCRASAQTVCERTLEAVTAYTGAVPQRDDITLVCIKADEPSHD